MFSHLTCRFLQISFQEHWQLNDSPVLLYKAFMQWFLLWKFGKWRPVCDALQLTCEWKVACLSAYNQFHNRCCGVLLSQMDTRATDRIKIQMSARNKVWLDKKATHGESSRWAEMKGVYMNGLRTYNTELLNLTCLTWTGLQEPVKISQFWSINHCICTN